MIGKNGKNGNEQAEPEPKSSAKIARLSDKGKKKRQKNECLEMRYETLLKVLAQNNKGFSKQVNAGLGNKSTCKKYCRYYDFGVPPLHSFFDKHFQFLGYVFGC